MLYWGGGKLGIGVVFTLIFGFPPMAVKYCWENLQCIVYSMTLNYFHLESYTGYKYNLNWYTLHQAWLICHHSRYFYLHIFMDFFQAILIRIYLHHSFLNLMCFIYLFIFGIIPDISCAVCEYFCCYLDLFFSTFVKTS